jgi:muconolactone delta-isomerase
MKTFIVRLTREVTESVDVKVRAKDIDEAGDLAYEMSSEGKIKKRWELDDGNEYVPYVSAVFDKTGQEQLL